MPDGRKGRLAPGAASLVPWRVVDEWTELARRIARTRPPWAATEDVARFYALAHALAPSVLSTFRLGREDVEDLVGDLLATKLQELVGREDAPRDDARSYFCASLKNRAISWRRKKATRVEEDRPLDAPGEEHTTRPERALDAREGLRVVEALLTHREREVLSAIHEGVAREDLAAALKTTRPNIDQIVRRARVKLQKAGLP